MIIAGFEDGKEKWANKYRQPLKSRKKKKKEKQTKKFSLERPEVNTALLTPYL